jgi:hypothetical protein
MESWHVRNFCSIESSLLFLNGLGPRKIQLILSRDRSDCRTGLDLIISFTEHLQIVTTTNYTDIFNSHTLQFTTARTKFSHSAVSSSADN